MPLIESSTITPDTQIKPVQTETGNDSPFHAIFGLSNGEKYIYEGATQLKAKKANIATNIKSITNDTHHLFPSVKAAIINLIKQGAVVTLDKTTFPTLASNQEDFSKNNKIATIDSKMITEYASLIETGDRHLFSEDVKVIAHAYTMTNTKGISIDFYENDTTGQQVVKTTFNPGQPHTGALYLQDTGNYQAVIKNHGTFTTKLAKITHPKPLLLARTGSYDASGLKMAFHGNIYQLKLLMLFAIKGQQDQLSFSIATEMDRAEKFDDLVFKSKATGEKDYAYNFLQAKHKQDNTKLIKNKDLLDVNDGEFSLPKYFTSYKKIKENPKFNDGILGKFYLCTNIDLDLATGLAFDRITESDRLLDTNIAGEVRYRIRKDPVSNKAIYDSFKKNTEGYKLAHEIVECIKNRKKITLQTLIFKEHQANLANAGIIEKGKFTDNFIKGKINNPAWVNEFRKLLIEEAPNKKSTDTKTLNTLFKEMDATNTFGQANRLPPVALEVKVTDTQIEEFFDHFVLAVNQSDEVQLGENIAGRLGSDFNLMDGDFIYSELEKAMLDWMKTKDGTFITHEAINQFFQEMRDKLSRFALIGTTLDYQEKLNQAGITFSKDVTIDHFLTHPTNQVLVCETPGDAFLSSIQIYQTVKSNPSCTASDSCVFVSLEKAGRIADLVKKAALDSNRVLVVVCKKTMEASDLDFITTLCSQLKPGAAQKIIIIANKDHTALLNTSPLSFVKHTTTNNFNALSSDSKTMVLNKPVRFQGSDTQLNKIVNKIDTVVDAEALMDIISHQGKSIQIGEIITPPENQDYLIGRQSILVGQSKPNARITLLTAEPGMGKTTMISHYITAQKEKNPNLWLIQVDLSALLIQHKLDKLKSPIDKDTMIAFFIGENPSPLARKVFEEKLENGDLVVTLDSFDAISTTRKTKVTELLKLLKDTKAQVFVTAIPDQKAILEQDLGNDMVATHELEPFNASTFLDKYLPIALASRGFTIDSTQFINTAKEFFLSPPAQAYLNNPLHIRLLIDYCLDQAKANQNMTLPTLYQMHQHFIMDKYNVYVTRQLAGKINESPYYPTYIPGLDKVPTINELGLQHQDCAFNQLFPTFLAQSTMQYRVHRNEGLLQSVGIVKFDQNQVPQFTHKSFEKYLAADFLFTLLTHNNQLMFETHYQPFLIRHIFQTQYKEVREFLAEMLSNTNENERKMAWDRLVQSHLLPAARNLITIQPDTATTETFDPILAKTWNVNVPTDHLTEWANQLVARVILPVLDRVAQDPSSLGQSTMDFLNLCNHTLYVLSRADTLSPIGIKTAQISILLKIIEKGLNFSAMDANLLFMCSNILSSFNKMGILIINTESSLLIQFPDGEFEYEIKIGSKALLTQDSLFELLQSQQATTMVQTSISWPLFTPTDPLKEKCTELIGAKIKQEYILQRTQSDLTGTSNSGTSMEELLRAMKRRKIKEETANVPSAPTGKREGF